MRRQSTKLMCKKSNEIQRFRTLQAISSKINWKQVTALKTIGILFIRENMKIKASEMQWRAVKNRFRVSVFEMRFQETPLWFNFRSFVLEILELCTRLCLQRVCVCTRKTLLRRGKF